jgi:exosortase K
MIRRLREPFTLVCLALAALVVLALKAHYSGASAGELAWILAPTAHLVGLAVASEFTFEAGLGWLSREEMFAIAPECAGVNFMLAAFVMLAAASTLRLGSPRARLLGLGTSLAVAYLAAIAVNTVRISIALRAGSLGDSLIDAPGLHRVQGIAVFFTALCLLWLAANRALPQEAADA